MKEAILNLLSDHNSKQEGIYIPTDLDQYVDKLLMHAKIIAVHEQDTLQGFIAYYNNDFVNGFGYLSMLLVGKDNQGSGLGSFLLEAAISDLKKKSFKTFKLEVLKTNEKALPFYRKHGFDVIEDRGDLYLMELQLN